MIEAPIHLSLARCVMAMSCTAHRHFRWIVPGPRSFVSIATNGNRNWESTECYVMEQQGSILPPIHRDAQRVCVCHNPQPTLRNPRNVKHPTKWIVVSAKGHPDTRERNRTGADGTNGFNPCSLHGKSRQIPFSLEPMY